MSIDLNYEEALDMYYSLKQKYEKKYNSNKAKIINDDELTRKQKQKKIKEIKMPCISCKKRVGTKFEEKDRKLIVVCGDQSNPCKLNIQIQKSETLNIKEYLRTVLEEHNDIENDIIRLKLSFLFGFINEEELTEVFDELKEKYKQNTTLLDSFNLFIKESLNTDERKENIRLLNIEKYNTVKEIKNMMAEFLATNNISLVKDSVELSLDTLNETLEKLRENKYREMFVETINSGNTKQIQLIQNEDSIQDLEYSMVQGEVLEFVM